MRQLLCCEESIYKQEETLQFEVPIEDSPILRAVAPHKQALTYGETVDLLRYDQLATDQKE